MNPSTKQAFSKAAVNPAPPRRKRVRPAPFSIRLNAGERAYLERKAGARPLGSYIRARLLDDAAPEKKTVSRRPAIDHALLARLLGLLGESETAKYLCLLVVAAEAGRVEMAEDDLSAVRTACGEVREMRSLLVEALGLKPGDRP